MTARRTACVFVFSCVLLLTQAAATADAAPPVSGWAASVPGSIFTLAGDPLIEGRASTFGQSITAIAVSGQTLYVADNDADVIRAVDISTDEERVIAGTSAAGFGSDGGPASAAELDDPDALAVDPQGDLLIADSDNGRVRLIAATDCSSNCPYGLETTTKGDIYTIAGVGPDTGFTEGPAVDSEVGEPRALAIDARGDLTISDRNLVLMVADYDCSEGCPYGLVSTTKGDIYHIAGREYDEEYDGDGEPATSAGMNPEGLAEDGEGNLLIVDSGNSERRVLLVAATDCAADCAYGLQSMTAGYVYTIAGGGGEAPASNGLATSASISPREVQVDTRGDVLLTEGFEEGRALMVAAETCASHCAYGLAATTKNHIYTIAGGGNSLEDGVPGTQAMLVDPQSMALIPDGGLLVVSDQSVRLLAGAACASGCPFGLPETSANDIYTVAGNGTAAFSGASGPPGGLELGWPRAVTSNSAGDVLVLDSGNGRVRMIAAAACSSDCAYGLPSTVQGDMYTIAGGGSGLENGVPAMSASLFGVLADGMPDLSNSPTSMTADVEGDVLVLDGGDQIRLIAASDCTSDCPYGLASVVEGNIYTVAGDGSSGYSGDGGRATSAELGDGARGMAVDPEGDLLIADTSNNRVRLLANVSCASDCPYGLSAMTKGDIYTIVGTGEPGDKGDNKPAVDAELFEPADVAVDGEGNLLIADTLALQVRFVAAHSCSSDCPYGRSSMTAGDMYPLAGDGALFYPQEVGTDGDGSSAGTAPMQPPQAVAVDSAGNVLISESEGSGGRSVVRMVAAATCTSDCAYGLPATVKGDIYTIVGVNSTISGFSGDGGLATEAFLDSPTGLGFDSAGDLLIADTYNNRIRLVTPAAKPQSSKKPEGGPQQPETPGGPRSESAASAAQAAPTQVNVRIEGKTKTLFEGPILTEGHDVRSSEPDGGNAAEDVEEHPCNGINPLDPQNMSPGPTPTAASVDAMSLIGETEQLDGQWYPGFEDYFVKRWGSEEENAEKEGKSWGILINNAYTNVGGCQYELSAGDEVLWIFNAFESKPILGLFAANEGYSSGERPLTAIAQLGKPFEVEVAAYDHHAEDQPPASPERTSANTEPYEGADVSPVSTSEKGFETVQIASPETVTTDSKGKASITFTTPGWHRIKAGTALNAKGEEKAIRSNRLDVCVPAAGETGCGEPPAEDRVRALPQYLEAHHEETPSTGGPPLAAGPSTTSPATLTQTPTHTASGPVIGLAVESISPAQLLLKLTAPGVATVKIARSRGEGRHRRWQTVKTISINASRAGALKIRLPRLAAGSYRVSISLAGAKTVVKTLTISSRRR
jgi:hypothetical protein